MALSSCCRRKAMGVNLVFLFATSLVLHSLCCDAFVPFFGAAPIPSLSIHFPWRTLVQHHGSQTSLSMAEKTPDAAQQNILSISEVSAKIQAAKESFDSSLANATTIQEAEAIRVKYLGKKGIINDAMSYMRLLSPEEKPKLGVVLNEIKEQMETIVLERKEELTTMEINRRMEDEAIDVTLPGLRKSRSFGHRHPLSMTIEKAVDIFVKLGYDTVTDAEDSPEIENDYYCFEALNCPKDHPSRDLQDTFYLSEDLNSLLRTHTSSVQIRQLEKRKPPLRIVAPGRVYRRDAIDATHSMVFHQVEILAIEEIGKLHLGHLKGTVDHFLRNMFGPSIQVRYRGSFFPFTEPSMEVDVFFGGKWLEVLGCGMVDPAVLEKAGIDPKQYGGFAAGFGVERFAMVMHGISDIREFYKNDVRFLDQFPHFYDEGMPAFLHGEDFGKDRVLPPLDPDFAIEDEISGDELKELKAKYAHLWTEWEQEFGTGNIAAATEAEKVVVNKQQSATTAQGGSTGSTKSDDSSGVIDISKLEIRVGVIKKAWNHEESDKLFCEEIDIGENEMRQIASGLRAHYQLEDLVGQRVLVVANLKSRKLAGFSSHGMVLCAADDGKVKFIVPPDGAPVGERVAVEGYSGDPATENQILKKKMMDVIFPDLKTNDVGVATYKGVPLLTSAGVCVAQDNIPNCQVS